MDNTLGDLQDIQALVDIAKTASDSIQFAGDANKAPRAVRDTALALALKKLEELS